MHLNQKQRATVFIALVVGSYLFTAFVPMMHYHKDGVEKNRCTVCYYYLNHHFQDLPSQFSVQKSTSFQIFGVFYCTGNAPKIVFLHDFSRAPPQLQTV